MARLARIVIPGIAHHVSQRGNRGERIFFSPEDSARYLELVAAHCRAAGTACWAYCLMPDHVHLILVPAHEDGLRAGLAEPHRRYSREINRRNGWTGEFWQGRFASFPVDEDYLAACARYIERKPVAAGLCDAPHRWRWSSARAHLEGRDDKLVSVAPLLKRVPDWAGLIGAGMPARQRETIQRHLRTGRPLGAPDFLDLLERRTGRRLRPAKRGPKPRAVG